jgi:hypothetical protein
MSEAEFYAHHWEMRAKFRAWKALRCKKCKCYVVTKTMASKYLSEQSCTVPGVMM